ncbi:MAG: DUF484 family protein [Janthinobacterium lividum]
MNDRDVAEYLLAHAEFFEQHAEVLGAVRLASPHGGRAVSLQERQMEMLREKNKLLERRLSELLRYGHENDSISSKFVRWNIAVLSQRDPHALPETIASGLRGIFDVPHVAVRIWDVAEAYSVASFARQVSEEIRLFASSLATPYCGPNTGFEAVQWLGTRGAASGAAAGSASISHLNAVPAHDAGAPVPAHAARNDASASAASDAVASVALVALRRPEDAWFDEAISAAASEGGSPSSSANKPGEQAFGLLVLGSDDPRRFHEGMSTDFLSQIGRLASAALTRLLPH